MHGRMWVFGYGSLMWNPGFPHKRTVVATLFGAHRRLCVYSTHYRGTRDQPGLVFGLDRGGSCKGLAFEVEAEDREAVVAYLRAREQITFVYREVMRPIRFVTGEGAMALTYVVDRRHPQYAAPLPPPATLDIVSRSCGAAGPNREYITSTADRLAALGIADRTVEGLARALRPPADCASA